MRLIHYKTTSFFFSALAGWILLFPFSSFAQGFELTFGGNGTQICNQMVIAPDSTIYMLGYTSTGINGANDFMLSKVSFTGQHLWTRNLGTASDDFGVGIMYTSSQQLLLAGTTSDSILNSQVLLIITDTSGTEITRHTYGTIESENIASARIGSDGGIVMSGYQTFSGTNYSYVLKLDSNYNEEWSAAFGANVNDYATDALMCDSTFYIVTDRRFNTGGGNFDYDNSVIKTTIDGTVIWDSVYHAEFQNGSQGMIRSQAGYFIFFGETEIFQFSPFDYFISSIDSNGNFLWRYTFGGNGSNALFDILENADGDIVGTGYGNTAGNGLTPLNLSLIKMDTLGNLIWQREYGYQGIDIGYTILNAPGGGYLVSGRATVSGEDDFYLLKVDEDGLTGIPETGTVIKNNLTVYPNPFYDVVHIKLPPDADAITVMDAMGRSVISQPVQPGTKQWNPNLSEYDPGVYLITVATSGNLIYRALTVKQ